MRITDPAFALPIQPLAWFVNDVPASGVRSAATKAAPGAGFRLVLMGFQGSTFDTVVVISRYLFLTQAASGTFTPNILQRGVTSKGVNQVGVESMEGMAILSSDNTPLTAQFNVVAATEFQTTTLWGFTVSTA